MKLRHRITKSLIATIMMFIMIMIIPMQTLAESPAKEYISELRTSSASNDKEAKKWLTDNGYKVIDNNINQGTGENPVYIGYKTTSDPKKAITDISVMEMNGGYSVSEYEAALEDKKQQVSEFEKSFSSVLKEFQSKYEDDSPAALQAYKQLNHYIEDDSNKKMGDYLIDIQDHEDLRKMILQGNTIFINDILTYMERGCAEEKENSWMEELSDLGSVTLSGRENALRYDEKASVIYDAWDDMHDIFTFYYDSGYRDNKIKSEDEITDYLNSLSNEDQIKYTKGLQIYCMLKGYSYGEDQSLIKFFLKPKSEISYEDLYPMAKVLTDYQISIIKLSGLTNLISFSNMSDIDWDKVNQDTEKLYKTNGIDFNAADSQISVYEGVDRNIFTAKGVALTTAALNRSASTGDKSWFDFNISNKAYIVAGIVVAISAIVFSYGVYIKSVIKVAKVAAKITRKIKIHFIRPKYSFFQRFSFYNGSAFMAVAIGIMLIAAGIVVGRMLYEYYHPEYKIIPERIVDGYQSRDGKISKFVSYKVVMNEQNVASDVNIWEGKQWNALYVTKDADAGNPITTDMIIKNNDNTVPSSDYSPVHKFEEKAAFNLNEHTYENETSIYMFVNRDSDPYGLNTGSVFSTGKIAVESAISLVGGALVGTFAMVIIMRRRKVRVVAG